MRKVFASFAAAAVFATMSAPAFAAEMTVKGELVDQTCYMKDHKNVGDAHKECAATCAKKGAPMAILTDDGKLYQITGDLAANNNAKLVPHVSHTVEVTGNVSEKDGKMMIDASSLKMAKKG